MIPFVNRAGWLRLYTDLDFHRWGMIGAKKVGEYRMAMALRCVDNEGRRLWPFPGHVEVTSYRAEMFTQDVAREMAAEEARRRLAVVGT